MRKIGTAAYSLDVNGHCALITNNRLVLIDTATQPDAADLLSEITKTGYKATDIETIIITHVHPDHVGGLQTIKDLSGAKIASHEEEAKFISKSSIYDGPPGSESQRHVSTPVDIMLKDGMTYEGFYVIHTPGHTPGHIALLDKELDLLIAGDALRNDANGFAPMPDQFNFDPLQHRHSIKSLGNYSFKHAIFGHGDPVENNAKEMLNSLINSDILD